MSSNELTKSTEHHHRIIQNTYTTKDQNKFDHFIMNVFLLDNNNPKYKAELSPVASHAKKTKNITQKLLRVHVD